MCYCLTVNPLLTDSNYWLYFLDQPDKRDGWSAPVPVLLFM